MPFDNTQPAYQTFRDLVKEGTASVIAWVGSGLSVAANLPTWSQLRHTLSETLRANASTFEESARAQALNTISQIKSQPDPWLALQMLEDALGAATFKDVIRKQLTGIPGAPIPLAYKHLWALGIKGMLTLNLDRIATRAYTEKNPGVAPPEFSGFQVPNVVHVLNAPRPFILNLHGVSEDSSSWVLTKKQLNALSYKLGYKQFITTCLSAYTILFVGLSVDDRAVGGHLDKLAKVAPGSVTHFWITSRKDKETHNWAEARQVRLIRYTSDKDHSELEQFFSDLRQFVPTDKIAPPVVRDVGSVSIDEDAMSPEILVRQDTEIVRRVLNAKARGILESNNPDRERQFDELCEKYDEAVHRAWFTKAKGGKLFDYMLGNQVAKGAFGTVYKATDKDGRNVAVKVLKEDLRNNSELLQSFRRGVKSMRILRDHSVPGMVPYIDATEIPAVVVMDWIDGPNLKEAVSRGYLNDWHSRLLVASSLAKTIRSAHSLTERVLHRDLRPPNIMLKEDYNNPDSFEVVVLDFDLSWHLGATEKSMILDSATGYLAPEQLQAIPSVSTRHASVDSFAMGMTLFFIVSGRDPVPAEHAHSNWQSTVKDACLTRASKEWASVPTRYGRAILSCTKAHQGERWDMRQIEGELERLKLAFENPTDVMSAELLAEEVIARTSYGKDYKWKDESLCAQVILPSGLELSLVGDESVGRVILDIGWTGGGQHPHKRLGDLLPPAGRRVQEMLKAHSWRVEGGISWRQAVHLTASMSIHTVRGNITKVVRSIDRAGEELRFE